MGRKALSDVLIYLGNKLDRQISGKFFEYLESGRPIICIVQSKEDSVSKLVKTLKAGVSCLNEAEEIYRCLQEIYKLWLNNELESKFSYSEESIRNFSWQNQAQKLIEFMLTI